MTGSAPAQAAGAVTEGATAYKIDNCYDDMLGHEPCLTTEGRALRVVLPSGRQINRDKGNHTQESHTKDGNYCSESGVHHSPVVHEKYLDPFFRDDPVGRLSTPATSCANGTT
ncbi:hypothetical protein [Kocuria sp. U4B]